MKEEAKTSKQTPEKSGEEIPRVSVSPPKTPGTAENDPVDLAVTEEEMASVEAATTKIRDSVGGTGLEIVLSPAIKKVKYNLLTILFLASLCNQCTILN